MKRYKKSCAVAQTAKWLPATSVKRQEKATTRANLVMVAGDDIALWGMGHFKKLKAWEHARALALVSKPLIARLPTDAKSGLASQWRRAANSVVLNIAEGASRPGPKEFRRHLGIARASLDEIEAIIDLAVGLDYLPKGDVARVSAMRDECARTVYGLMRKLDS